MRQHIHELSCQYLGCSMTDFDNRIRERIEMRAVDHIDGDTSNNDLSNIKIVNVRDNLPHQPLDTLNAHDLVELRKIIAEVIAEDWYCSACGLRHRWQVGDTSVNHHRRLQPDFIEAIIAKVVATAAPSLREETTIRAKMATPANDGCCLHCNQQIKQASYGPPINDSHWYHVGTNLVWCDASLVREETTNANVD